MYFILYYKSYKGYNQIVIVIVYIYYDRLWYRTDGLYQLYILYYIL